jgi:hypothetical protein
MASTQNTLKTAQYLSREEIREVATELVDFLTDMLAGYQIPQPYEDELETDEATVELRNAIEHYIARMQDERAPY